MPPSVNLLPPDSFEVFMSLFLRHELQVLRYLRTLVPRPEDAEDLLQETAITLWRRFDQFEEGTNFYAWACQTARFKVLEYRRRRSTEVPVLDADVVEMLARDAAEKSDLIETRVVALRSCIKKLRPKDQELIQRRYLHDQDGIQVAAELGRPVNSVYQSLGRIRRTLLECINRSLATDSGLEGGIA